MIELGVLRQVMRITAEIEGVDRPNEVTAVGSMIGHIEEPRPGEEPFVGDVVIYTLGLDRLRGMLTAAARGDDVDGIILSLDAAALASDEHADDDGDHDP